MAKWKFDKQQYQEDKIGFLVGLREMISVFFGENNTLSIPTLESDGEVPFAQKTNLELILDALPEVIQEGKWDIASLPNNHELLDGVLAACQHFVRSEYGVKYYAFQSKQGEFTISDDFENALQLFYARGVLKEKQKKLNTRHLALLADMDERSVRNAIREEFGDSINELGCEQAKEWLSKRRGFKPTIRYNSRVSRIENGQVSGLVHYGDVTDLINFRLEELDLYKEKGDWILQNIGKINIDHPEILYELAEFLQFNPSWFVKTTMELYAEADIEFLRCEQQEKIDEAMESLGLDKDFSDQPEQSASLEYSTADNIRTLIGNTARIWNHPKYSGSNAKIDCYIAKNGRAIAHEHNLKRQSLWVQSNGLQYKHLDIKCTEQPSHIHSGLGKYPELNQPNLVRFYPKNIGQVKQILDAVIEAEPVRNDQSNTGE